MGGGSGGRNRDGVGATCSDAGVTKRKTVAKKTTVAQVSRRRNKTGGSQVSSDRSGGKYRAEGTDQEESAYEKAKWSGKETEGSATGDEVETAGGGQGVVSKMRTVTAHV